MLLILDAIVLFCFVFVNYLSSLYYLTTSCRSSLVQSQVKIATKRFRSKEVRKKRF